MTLKELEEKLRVIILENDGDRYDILRNVVDTVHPLIVASDETSANCGVSNKPYKDEVPK